MQACDLRSPICPARPARSSAIAGGAAAPGDRHARYLDQRDHCGQSDDRFHHSWLVITVDLINADHAAAEAPRRPHIAAGGRDMSPKSAAAKSAKLDLRVATTSLEPTLWQLLTRRIEP
jgi:hypothetical protein